MRLRSLILTCTGVVLIAGVLSCGSSSPPMTDAEEMGDMSDLGAQLFQTYADARTVLSSITNEETATEAAPKLDEINEELDRIADSAKEADDETQARLSEITAAQIPGIQELTDKVYAIPGVKPVVQPPLDSMLAKFMSFE